MLTVYMALFISRMQHRKRAVVEGMLPMDKKANVLVFSSSVYPALQVIGCLKNSPLFHVIAAASYPNHAEYICKDTVTDLPYISNPDFLKVFHT